MALEWQVRVPGTEGVVKNTTLFRGEKGGASWSLLLMEKTYTPCFVLAFGSFLHTFCFNGRNIDAMGAHQEGFLEEVMSKL